MNRYRIVIAHRSSGYRNRIHVVKASNSSEAVRYALEEAVRDTDVQGWYVKAFQVL